MKQKQRDSKPVESTMKSEELSGLPVDQLLAQLAASELGLTSQEAENRLRIFGRNEIAKRKRRAAVVEFLYHVRNPLVAMLLLAGVISGVLGETIDAIIIFSIVLLSVVLDVYQESKAEKAAELLKEKVTTTATALRDGVKKEVKLSEIVPGDVVFVSAGDMAPADARVLSAKDLFMDQSALTGESFPVEKTPEPTKTKDAAVSEWSNYLFLGTSVVSGAATAVAVKTGSSTEFGKIARELSAREPETEFERGLRRFGFLMTEITLLLVLFVFFTNAFFKRGVLDSLLFAVALAVGLTPELLPMIMTVNLSQGALAMSKRGVIVKRLASIQNFGSMDVLCTDKTGTLTENKITLMLHVDVHGHDDQRVLLYSYLNSQFETGLKSPLDEAILRYRDIDTSGYEKIDEVPFDFTRRRVSVVVEGEHQRLLIAKGAPEEIAKACSYCQVEDLILDLTSELHKKIEEEYDNLSSQGFRVLAVSYAKMREKKAVYSVRDERDMIFLGFVAFLDPPKVTARESLQQLKKTGIELKILTGDNELVTRKTCDQLGFEIKGVVLGPETTQMRNDALSRVVEKANIFARVTPSQKDRIMNALKNNGHVVGFLGDGINDAPSLKTSDVGISVNNAVDIAKESADIILLEKGLGVLGDGVAEGRRSFGNTMKYIMIGTSSNFGNMFSVAGASLFLEFLPMLPIQILLNNLLYDMSELAIPSDNVDPEYVEKPKKLDISYIRRFMIVLGPVSSLFDFLTFFFMLFFLQSSVPLFRTAWFIESLCTQTLVVFVIRTRRTPFYKSKPGRLLILSSFGVIAAALVMPYTPLGELFEFVMPPLAFFAVLVALVGAYLLIVELVKTWFLKRHSNLLEQVPAPTRS